MKNPEKLTKLIAAENWSAAERFLRAASKKSTATADTYYNLGKVLQVSEKYRQSGPWFKRAVQKNDRYQIAWFELGKWSLLFDTISNAHEAFASASALDPDDHDALRNLGRTALRIGNWEIARTVWLQFTDLEAKQALYRVKMETGENANLLREELLKAQTARPEVISTLIRTAKGSIPLKL